MNTLSDPDTPFAVVDIARSRRNISRLADRLSVPLRPHVKTAKSIDIANLMHGGRPGPITVSTLAEAEQFADAGYTDITYAVGIDPHKLPRVVALQQRGVAVQVLLDSVFQAEAVVAAGVPALIEVDCDGHRGGVTVDDPALVKIASLLGDCFAGVLVHAGESYFEPMPDGQRRAAETERAIAVAAADRIRAAGITVRTISVGSTPTAHAAVDLTGVTEVRAGNYVLFDLVMAGIGVCTLSDLALSVVVTVIGHRPEKGWILTDGGWMALSRDRGTAAQSVDQGYGIVADLAGTVFPQLVVSGASQEHGVLSTRDGSPLPDHLPVGTRLRILPNHACATAAQHRRYQVVDSDLDPPDAVPRIRHAWDRIGGW
jgi:D-serine deaminase-like pyridoxal phosphate-dependent protein